jgi:hypothetical protein
MKVTFKAKGRMDFMGFKSFFIYEDGEPVIIQGIHESLKAVDKDHALAMYNQLKKLRGN